METIFQFLYRFTTYSIHDIYEDGVSNKFHICQSAASIVLLALAVCSRLQLELFLLLGNFIDDGVTGVLAVLLGVDFCQTLGHCVERFGNLFASLGTDLEEA